MISTSFGGNVTIGGRSFTAIGNRDVLVSSVNASGALFWSNPVHFESSGADDHIYNSCYDSASATFSFCGTLDGKTIVKQGASSIDSVKYVSANYFVANFSATGARRWVYPDSGTTNSEANAVVSDENGFVYVAGRFNDSLEVDTTLYGSSIGDLFLLKIRISGGVLQWARKISGPGKEQVSSLVYDAASSRIVVLGNFEDSLFAGSSSIAPLVKGRKDVFAARYDAGGSLISLKTVLASTADIEVLDADIPKAGGGYVLTGRFNGSISGTSPTIITNGGYDILISRISSSDVALITKGYGGNSNEEGNEIEINVAGRSFVQATYESSTITFGSDTIRKSGVRDVCLLASLVNLNPLGGKGNGIMQLPTDQIYATAMSHSSGALVVGNRFRGRAKYGNAGTFTSPAGNFDMAFAQVVPSKIFCNTNVTLLYTGFRLVGIDQHLCSMQKGEVLSLADTSYDFQWYRKGVGSLLGDTTNEISISDAGVYFVEIKKMSGSTAICIDTFYTDSVIIDLLPQVNISDTSTCNNVSIAFALSTNPVFSSVTDSLFGKGIGNNRLNAYNPSIPGVGTGIDSVIFQRIDATTGCIGRDTAEVTVNARPVITISNVRAYCQGEPADTLKYASAPIIDKDWYSMINPTWGIKDSIVFRCDSLINGFHRVKYNVIDTNNCAHDTTISLQVKQRPTVSLNLSKASVCKNGSIFNLSGQSPTGGYFMGVGVLDSLTGRYDPDSTQYRSDTIRYVYTATNGCGDTATDILTIDTIPIVSFVFADTICDNDPIYILKATPEAKNPGETATFSGHPAVSGSNFFPRISGVGFHKVLFEFEDQRGCSDTMSSLVEVKNLPSVSLPNLGSFCENNGDTLFDVGTPKGGQYYYKQYLLVNDIFKPDTSYINYGVDTVYYVYADSFKCQNTAFNFVSIKQKPGLFVNQSFFDNLCNNSDSIALNSLGISVVSPPPANGGFFSFDSVNQIDHFDPIAYSQIPLLLRPALAFSYKDIVSGCSNTLGVYPDIKTSPRVAITHAGAACAGLDYNLTASGALEWEWSTGDTTTTITIVQDSSSTYWVKGKLGICFDSISTQVEITPGEMLYAKDDSVSLQKGSDVTLDPLARLYPEDTLKLIGTFEIYEGPKESRSFDTTAGVVNGLNSTIYYEPKLDFRRTDSSLYRICNVSCANICDSAKVIYYVLGNPYEFIPSAFTPNGDGVNDFWVVPGIESYLENEVYIYNRWGDLVYQAAPYENQWEGQTNKGIAGGKKLVDGTYFYVLKTNRGEPIKGTVELKTK
tara:strand:+ start:2346 stop:6179 length:3834 start_codon:yes stop_codon:yes gene_type:complete